MTRWVFGIASAVLLASSAWADLAVGDPAPDFVVQGYQAGDAVEFNLEAALTEGPVLMFFFPAAFTSGCEAQAANFAESIDEFEALGVTVIGLTAGNTDRLADFSTQHCASAFPVFAVPDSMIRDYDARLRPGGDWTGRITYVVDADSRIAFHYADLSPYEHVDRSLAALRELSSQED